jgi:hypothetical protein
MGYKPKTKNKFSNFAFPTTYAVDYAKPIYDETISQVTYGNPSYGSTLANVIESAKESGVSTPAIATVTTPASLDSFIASNAYSNRAAYYDQVQAKLTNTTFKIPDPSGSSNAFLKQFQEKEAEREKALVEAARLKAESDAKAKAEADRVAASLDEAKRQADAPSGNKQSPTQEIIAPVEVEAVTPVSKAKSSNAMLYIGVIAIGIVGLMLLKNR